MKKLAAAILEAIAELYGPAAVLRVFRDPFLFQAFNNAIGMDWDSSGSTTVTTAIAKEALRAAGVAVRIAGGKGKKALETPRELEEAAKELGLSESRRRELLYASRIAAKTDNVLLQDGYTLYHHVVVVAETGDWVIVQQGMNPEARLARRYHWAGPLEGPPTLEPHSAIASARREEAVIDATSRRSLDARRVILDLARERPSRVVREVAEAYRILRGDTALTSWMGLGGRRVSSVVLRVYRPQARPPRHLEPVLNKLYELQPSSIEELVMVKGVGPAVLRSLALVAELLHSASMSHEDPATQPLDPFRYAYIVGGKDGVPFPFRRDYAEKVLEFLRGVVEEARLEPKHKRQVAERLERLARLLATA